MKIVIIGSGMAGLTAGAVLSKAGHPVTVFEQFPTPGGVTATVTQDGFSWDIGPLLVEGFAPGDKGRLILEELGVSDRVPSVHEDRGLSMPEFALWKPKDYEGPFWRYERLKQLFPQESSHLDSYYRFYDPDGEPDVAGSPSRDCPRAGFAVAQDFACGSPFRGSRIR